MPRYRGEIKSTIFFSFSVTFYVFEIDFTNKLKDKTPFDALYGTKTDVKEFLVQTVSSRCLMDISKN
jgi:hypothetical protein